MIMMILSCNFFFFVLFCVSNLQFGKIYKIFRFLQTKSSIQKRVHSDHSYIKSLSDQNLHTLSINYRPWTMMVENCIVKELLYNRLVPRYLNIYDHQTVYWFCFHFATLVNRCNSYIQTNSTPIKSLHTQMNARHKPT